MGQFLGSVIIGAWSVVETVNPGGIRRETGLKPLNGFRLKGLLINYPRRLIGKSGKQEGARFPQQFPDFPLSRFKKNGEVPINQHSLKAGLRRDGSPAQTSPSEYRLQPEVCEGLQARAHGNTVLYRLTRPPVIGARLTMRPAHTPPETDPLPVGLRGAHGRWAKRYMRL
jgi:hypothetical protein